MVATQPHPLALQWMRGFYGQAMVPGCESPKSCSRPYCDFPRTIPWVDFLPEGTQNWWTGSQRCQASCAVLAGAGDYCSGAWTWGRNGAPALWRWRAHGVALLLSEGCSRFAPMQQLAQFEASFDHEGLLTITNCAPGQRMEYTGLPRTEQWPAENRTFWNDKMHPAVMAQLQASAGGMAWLASGAGLGAAAQIMVLSQLWLLLAVADAPLR